MQFTQINKKSSRNSIQKKLKIGAADDKYEQEADAMANQVMAMPKTPPLIQRKGEDSKEGTLQMKPLSETNNPAIQKQPMEEEEETLQMKTVESTTSKMIQKEGEKEEEEKDSPYKLKLPEFGSSLSLGYKSKLSLGIPELKLDPKLAFDIEMMKIRMMLSPGYLMRRASLIGNPALLPPLGPLAPVAPTVPAMGPMPKPPSGASAKPAKAVKPRKGKPGDLVKALLAIPIIKTKLDEIKADAEKYAKDKYDGLSGGGKFGVITGGVTLVGGIVAGLLAMPKEDRMSLLGPLSGVAIPIPGVPISVTYSSMGLNTILPGAPADSPKVEQVMFTVNVGELLPKSWGMK